jgi:prevent-host-death family protein
MREETISVTEAARNFADCVNRVRYQNMTFVLVKNGVPVARIVPDGEKTCTAGDLAEALRKVELSPTEFKTWSRDLRKARKALKPQPDKWR